MVMADVVVSEVLCFLFNKFVKCPKMQLKNVLVSFYSEDELIEAKDVLWSDVDKLDLDNMPRKITRSKGDNRAKIVAEDVLELIVLLDERGCIGKLPIYTARNLDRIPPVKVEELEIFCVSKKIEAVEQKLAALEEVNLTELSSRIERAVIRLDAKHDTVCEALAKVNDVLSSGAELPPLSQAPLTGTIIAANDLGAEGAAVAEEATSQLHSSEPQEWSRVENRKQRRVRLRGTANKAVGDGSVGTVVRAVPRKPVLAAFVGRLHKDTTPEELSAYLTAEGMKGVVCRKLKPKNGETFRTAAFYVSCCIESRDSFYDESRWPEGVELRDWIYK